MPWRELSRTFPARRSEWALAAMLFLWFVVLSVNDDLFSTGRTYGALSQLMSQQAWALACLAIGGSRLVVLAINGAWRRSPHLRAIFSVLSGFFWFQITLGILEAGAFNTGLAIYPILFLLDSSNAITAVREAGISDATHMRGRGHGSTDA